MKNVIDWACEKISPAKALERERARYYLSKLKEVQGSGYSEGGASRRKNSLKAWPADSGSPHDDIDLNLSVLRKRSRSLYMNGPIAAGAINTNRTNVVGSGLVLKPRIDYEYLGMSQKEAKKLESRIKKLFAVWSESKTCCCTGLNNFAELQQIALLSWLLNGDAFALPVYDKMKSYMPFQLRIKLVEGDRITTPGSTGDTEYTQAYAENGNRIYSGVEINKQGTVQAYYVCNSYPSDYRVPKEWVRIPAYNVETGTPNVLHIFNAERAEQYRGVPYLAPVIETIKQMTRYTEAEIMAAVINGIFSVFVKTEDGSDDIDFGGIDEAEEVTENEYALGNGIINYLQKGESVEIADAKRPNVNFVSFTDGMAKYVGSALGIPKDLLLKEFNASYSASRGALLEAWKDFRMRRKWFADDFCQPVYELWLVEAVSKGYIEAPGFFLDPFIRRAYSGALWNGPAPGQLDPVKEAQAAELRMKNCLSTAEREATEINGSDFDYNVTQRKIEKDMIEEAGLENV